MTTSQLTDQWTPKPTCICDFGWYDHTGALFPPLSYRVNNVTYPPADWTWSSGGQTYTSEYKAYYIALGQAVTFDAVDTLALGIPKTIAPAGVQIINYAWDLGNGQTGIGPTVSVTYNYPTPPPDLAVTLTITDSLGRTCSTRHPLTPLGFTSPSGNMTQQRQGSGRT